VYGDDPERTMEESGKRPGLVMWCVAYHLDRLLADNSYQT
jgi:hypothetical protein